MMENKNNNSSWEKMSDEYETSRKKEDSLDTLVEWPAQKSIIGNVEGKSSTFRTTNEGRGVDALIMPFKGMKGAL